VGVSQRLKSLRGILVRNCGFSKSDFFVVYEDIWIAKCPFFVVVLNEYIGHESLTLNDIETPIIENLNIHMYPKHRYGMKVDVND
jgi:hypothetical protein